MEFMDQGNFKVGDFVKIYFRSAEDQKIKQAPFEGTVIAKRGAVGGKTFTVRKVASAKVAVERIFPLDSPTIEKVEVLKHQKVRRAKLYYLRKEKN